jgi:hypothetical protein
MCYVYFDQSSCWCLLGLCPHYQSHSCTPCRSSLCVCVTHCFQRPVHIQGSLHNATFTLTDGSWAHGNGFLIDVTQFMDIDASMRSGPHCHCKDICPFTEDLVEAFSESGQDGHQCHDPRDRDNNFSLSQVYSIFFDYMRQDIFSKSLILYNYTLFFHCYDHVTCNLVCFVTCGWLIVHTQFLPSE